MREHATAGLAIAHDAVAERKERVIPAETHVASRMDLRAELADEDRSGENLLAAGLAVNEKLWRLPLGDVYDKQIDSAAADMKNTGGRAAGSITAAQFLQRFVNKTPWAHLDIAGMAWSGKERDTVPKGGTGYGVRLLDRLVADCYEG